MYRVSFAVMFAFALVVSSLFVQTKRADALSYDGSNPYTTGCAYKSSFVYQTKSIYMTTATGSKVILGYLQLWGSAYCHTAWAEVHLYGAAPYNGYANAMIHRSNGTESNCWSSGGNGTVDEGQHSCHTGQLWDKDPYQSWSAGDIDNWGAYTDWF
ncbi:YjfA family protein [Shimazuella sp. AN120528]|uniref:DUF2690 domain-containing protein n=1 Tax=Shimazuella soli TaxID=1892854 RepID=UPI001F0F9E7B|nr:DUF2690 domain-containing protein [Shimazuella soli]MCH5584793.1 YjfA family protein [Shimazuella soli]